MESERARPPLDYEVDNDRVVGRRDDEDEAVDEKVSEGQTPPQWRS